MRIEWLNEERTRALVTRGWLWWRRQAEVVQLTVEEALVRRGYIAPWRWFYAESGDQFEGAQEVADKKIGDEFAEQQRAIRERNWHRATKQPRAIAKLKER